MTKILFVTGGARSGKSSFAESQVRELGGDKVLYIATAAVCDEEMEDRVKKHRESRPSIWKTLEQYSKFETLPENQDFLWAKAAIVDCVGFMLNNIMFEKIKNWDDASIEEMEDVEGAMVKELENLCSAARKTSCSLVIVSNEIGMGLVPENRINRYYRDILGRANQLAARLAEEVYFCVSGIPMKVKG